MFRAIAFCAPFLLAVACDKSSSAPPAPAQQPAAQPDKKATPAPAGVPQTLKDMVDRDWPAIEAAGNAFVTSFEAASKAHAANDRAAMDVAIEAANAKFVEALDAWNAIVYWPEEELTDEKQQEACRRFLSTWNKQVESWGKKNKALKEFSRVK